MLNDPCKILWRKRQTVHKRKQKYFYFLISPQNTLWRANQTKTKIQSYTVYKLPHKVIMKVKNEAQYPSKALLVLCGPTRARKLQQEESLRKEWVDNPAA